MVNRNADTARGGGTVTADSVTLASIVYFGGLAAPESGWAPLVL